MGTPYVLEGRDLESQPAPPKGQDVSKAPCIFCGKKIRHQNDGGVGWVIGAMVNGEPHMYMHCHDPACDKVEAHAKLIWRCACVGDYVENVGEFCHECGKPNAEVTCPACDTRYDMGQIARITLVERYELITGAAEGEVITAEPHFDESAYPAWSRPFYRCAARIDGHPCGYEWPVKVAP